MKMSKEALAFLRKLDGRKYEIVICNGGNVHIVEKMPDLESAQRCVLQYRTLGYDATYQIKGE